MTNGDLKIIASNGKLPIKAKSSKNSNTNNSTISTIAIIGAVGIAVYLAYKFWPREPPIPPSNVDIDILENSVDISPTTE